MNPRSTINPDTTVNTDTKAYLQPSIVVTELTKVYEKPKPRGGFRRKEDAEPTSFTAVDKVSFAVKPGEIFVIMGLSGSGKSTIIRMLNRLIDITDGTVSVNGDDVGSMDDSELRGYRNATINMVFQHFGLFPHKSLIDNVAFGLKVRGVPEATRMEKAAEALRIVGLGERLYALPEQLSGGQRQRVGLARALATDAEILLMDEPFSALDPLIRKEMQDLLLQLQRDLSKTIIFVTHDLNEAMHLGDQILVMKQGKMAQLGRAIDLLDNPANDYIEEFTAEVDRSRVITARMLAVPPMIGDEFRTGPAAPNRPHVEPGITLQHLLPIFADGADAVEVVRASDGKNYGSVTPTQAFAALSPKRRAA
ncbi:ATP-binding cassette domain-containing protein [Pseudoclavibacter sp. RFBA6]|uniref:ATP-binding cassette domain-containing protein n=1 Tax=Pseudoclavibacter sp. RFBA6 TaxID=2080573 RepID=UPI000CE883DF|nr:ATP-binding cassette domain-containing protein [Pseudoclavibacter sp. RFBA6]PPG38152.1 glycine/betaine ABC transporter ATP-binding protein [Pseudoclavibacter sp. RFBA6]